MQVIQRPTLSSKATDFERFRGQWGGKTESGEEMWWTEPNRKLFGGLKFARLRFLTDTRQFLLYRYLKAIIAHQECPVIVDFGCGTGGLTLSFSKMIERPIKGYDIFPTQIEIANTHAQEVESACSFQLLDSTGNLPLEKESVDAVFSADVLGHVPDIPKTLCDWYKVLKPGGGCALFTEASYSSEDRSLQARLARRGLDMCEAVPEHISLFPRETLEKMFQNAGFEICDQRSANIFHWFFFPKDYVLLFEKFEKNGPMAWLSKIWNRISKLLPFYPIPQEALRLFLTLLFGKNAYGTSYFYYLRKPSTKI